MSTFLLETSIYPGILKDKTMDEKFMYLQCAVHLLLLIKIIGGTVWTLQILPNEYRFDLSTKSFYSTLSTGNRSMFLFFHFFGLKPCINSVQKKCKDYLWQKKAQKLMKKSLKLDHLYPIIRAYTPFYLFFIRILISFPYLIK